MKAGLYIISDPCYVMSDEQYDALMAATYGAFASFVGGVVDVLGYEVAVFNTAYGDGLYYDNQGRDYGVDAGWIACMPSEMIPANKNTQYVHLEEFDRDFEVWYDRGTIEFGGVKIETDPEEDEDYE